MASFRFAIRVVVDGTIELGGEGKTQDELSEAAVDQVMTELYDHPCCDLSTVKVEVVDETEL